MKKLYFDLTKKEKRLTKSFMDFLQYADGTNSLEKISVLINKKNVKDSISFYGKCEYSEYLKKLI